MTAPGVTGLGVQLLGPVQAWRDGRELELGGPMQRAVFAVLVLRVGRVVSRSELIDALWTAAPASAGGNVHSYISGLRKVLEAVASRRDVLVSTGSGYVLRLADETVDVRVVDSAWQRAHIAHAVGDGAAVVTELEGGLALWRGVPLAGLEVPFAEAERARLAELRLSMVQLRAEVLLELGRASDAVAGLQEVVLAEPLRERLAALLMLALYRGGRQADALAVFDHARRSLGEDLGVVPGPELRLLQQRILRSAPDLMTGRVAAGSVVPGAVKVSTRGTIPAQFPIQVTGFVGRVEESATLSKWCAADQEGKRAVLLVTGPGGVGKTALAVRSAQLVKDKFPDGQLYVNLQGFSPGPPMPTGVALNQLLRALGVDAAQVPASEAEQSGLYRTLLDGKQMVIVLDNARDSGQVESLLPGTGGCLVLITSRNGLGGLTIRFGARRLSLGPLDVREAVALLAETIGAERVHTEPDAATELIALCSYLPLAIRVAAERVDRRPKMALSELVGELADERSRLDALDTDDDALASVRTVLSWSYQALSPAQASALRLLGLHPGPEFSTPAAAVLIGDSMTASARLLEALAAQHLLEPVSGDRYRFHDLLHLHAAELAATEEEPAARRLATRRLLSWYLASAEAARDAFYSGQPPQTPVPADPIDPQYRPVQIRDFQEAMNWFDLELSNLIAVARRAADTDNHDLAWRLPCALHGFFYLTKHWTEWLAMHHIGLSSAEQLDDNLGQAIMLNNLGHSYWDSGRPELAVGYLRRSLSFYSQTTDRSSEFLTLTMLSDCLGSLGQADQALTYAQRAVASARKTGNQRGESYALGA
ncbi:MAG: hypothetical protein QOG99_997, partial [Frankiales bacterium]|nr:hypothetical protein [Frankiales bacterium]